VNPTGNGNRCFKTAIITRHPRCQIVMHTKTPKDRRLCWLRHQCPENSPSSGGSTWRCVRFRVLAGYFFPMTAPAAVDDENY